MSIKKVLIANRGEIACRVIKTCKKMGVATVAVYSEADTKALHVSMADEAYLIGLPPVRDSYLNISKILEVAKESGADAVHPGYGLLSENADFVEAVTKAGLIFIGPPSSAMRAMAGKSESKALMEKAGVPLVPGYHGDNQDEKSLRAEAEKIGFPVLIKASAGGGGKGMRICESVDGFAEALTGAKREGAASFGSDHVLIEKYLASPRHVEMQVFADTHGTAVHLFERDCSVQRRHQKVLEEAPAPGMTQTVRDAMGQAALDVVRAVNYVGAGTVEFLLGDDGAFYFMEMNTRLQVEHPVTEMITGLDLVEWQILIAQGEKLPLQQNDLKINGHAFEARLYTEDPENNFLPGAGKIQFLKFPVTSNTVRIDTGVYDGDTISIHYDPMVAKVITWGKDRAAALQNMASALDDTHVAGPKSNLKFLRRLVRHEAFQAGKVNTQFITDYKDDLIPPKSAPAPETLALAVLGLLAGRKRTHRHTSDPWNDLSTWCIGGHAGDRFTFGEDVVQTMYTDDGVDITLPDGKTVAASFERTLCGKGITATVAGHVYHAYTVRNGACLRVMYRGCYEDLDYKDPLYVEDVEDEGAGKLTAPMPGKVVAIHAKVGADVKKGEALVVVEAMKMEHTITAPFDGKIASVHAAVGDQVDEKLELVRYRDAS